MSGETGKRKMHESEVSSAATKLRRIVVTHTASYVFDPAEIERVWPAILPVLGCFPRGDEDDGSTPCEGHHGTSDASGRLSASRLKWSAQ